MSRKYCLRKARAPRWRKVLTDQQKANVGPAALDCQPKIEQLFVGAKEIFSDILKEALFKPENFSKD